MRDVIYYPQTGDPCLILYLVDSDGLAIEFDHIHDLDGIVCILLSHELYKPIALVELCDAVTRHVHIHCIHKGQEALAYFYTRCVYTAIYMLNGHGHP